MGGHCCSDDGADFASKVEWRENNRQTIDEYQVRHLSLTTPNPYHQRTAGVAVGKQER